MKYIIMDLKENERMATFTIFYGAEKSIRVVGKNQCRLAEFAERNRGWHSYHTKCRSTRRAVVALEEKGYLEVDSKTGQFRFCYPKH